MSRPQTLDAGPIIEAVTAARRGHPLTQLLGAHTAPRRAFDRAHQHRRITPAAAAQLCEVIDRLPVELYPKHDWFAPASSPPPRRRRPRLRVALATYQAAWDALAAAADGPEWTGDLVAQVAAVTGPADAPTVARALLMGGWVVRLTPSHSLPAAPLVAAVTAAAGDRPLRVLLGSESRRRRNFRRARRRGAVSRAVVQELCTVIGQDPGVVYPERWCVPHPSSYQRPGRRRQSVRPLRWPGSCYLLVCRPAEESVQCARRGCDATVPRFTVADGLHLQRSRVLFCRRCRRSGERESAARAADQVRRAAGLPATGSHKLTIREMRAIARLIGQLRSTP